MSYLLDTNVISEVRKGARCNRKVAAWFESVEDDDLYLSVLVLGEIRKGIEAARPRDPSKAGALERWLRDVEGGFVERILGIDRVIAEEWGRMAALKPLSVIDGLLAATAKTHDLTLVTRNIGNVAWLGARVLDPFR